MRLNEIFVSEAENEKRRKRRKLTFQPLIFAFLIKKREKKGITTRTDKFFFLKFFPKKSNSKVS